MSVLSYGRWWIVDRCGSGGGCQAPLGCPLRLLHTEPLCD